MTIIEQLNAHPRLSRAATSIHLPDMDGDTETAVRAVVDERGAWWSEHLKVAYTVIPNEQLGDVDALISLLLQQADEEVTLHVVLEAS